VKKLCGLKTPASFKTGVGLALQARDHASSFFSSTSGSAGAAAGATGWLALTFTTRQPLRLTKV
jgi:hypothetical protein